MPDYEILNAREWDLNYQESEGRPTDPPSKWTVVAPKKAVRPTPSIQPLKHVQHSNNSKHKPNTSFRKSHSNGPPGRPPIHKPRLSQPRQLTMEVDNEAESSWRRRNPPTDHIQIPEDLALQDQFHENIARQYGAFVAAGTDQGVSGQKEFGIWGDGAAVAAAKRAIALWISEEPTHHKDVSRRTFYQMQSLSQPAREKAEKRWRREVKRQKFRQNPPPSMTFPAIGSFQWPVHEYRPEDVLGSSYEALDPIRMNCSCYVVFSKERNTFRVMGKADSVQDGLLRLRRTCFQIAARQISPVRLFLLHWPGIERNIPTHVLLESHTLSAILSPANAARSPTGNSPRGEGIDVDEMLGGRAEEESATNHEKLRKNVMRTLQKLHFYRGNVQLRFRLGTFLATQYRKPRDNVYELSEYESMIQESQFTGYVTTELGHLATEHSARRMLQAADDLLVPSDSQSQSLGEVKPLRTAVFTIADAAGDLRLTKSWQETRDYRGENLQYDEIRSKWARLDRDSGEPTALLDASLTDLGTGSAWQVDLRASQCVDERRLAQQMLQFADSVHIDANAVRNGDLDAFVKCKQHASLKSIQQRTSYRYRITNSDYTLELVRYQICGFSQGKSPVVYEPRWSLEVFRVEWESMLARNESAGIGERADWPEDSEAWFPADVGPGSPENTNSDVDFGWIQLVEKLEAIERVVRRHGGS